MPNGSGTYRRNIDATTARGVPDPHRQASTDTVFW